LILVSSLLAVAAPSRAQVCGDGVIDPGETCDPPNSDVDAVSGQPKCRFDCTFCGDGIVDAGDTESCDAGPYPTCGDCLPNCDYRVFEGKECPCAFDDASLVDVRADILASCHCGTASSHRAFVRCARDRLALVSLNRLVPRCRRTALKCLARSVCGKPGAVTCCLTKADGRRRCVIKRDAAQCAAPTGGSASLGVSDDCCDACP
jgi:hypothetical protein